MTGRGRLLAGAAVVLAVALGTAGLARYPLDMPSKQDGTRWTNAFLTTVGGKLLEARGPAVVGLMPALSGPGEVVDGCPAYWAHAGFFAPILLRQALQIEKPDAQSCDTARLLFLSTTIRISDGISPDAFNEWLTKRYGPPAIRVSDWRNRVTFTWTPVPTVEMELSRDFALQLHDSFVFNVNHTPGEPIAAIPSQAEEDGFIDTLVETLTDPKLAGVRRQDAAGLFGGLVNFDTPRSDGCYSLHKTFSRDPFLSSVLLNFEDAATPAACGTARLSEAYLSIPRSHALPVSSLIRRLGKKLRDPVASTIGDLDVIDYTWTVSDSVRLSITDQPISNEIRLRLTRR